MTYLEVLRTLPSPYREKAVANVISQRGVHTLYLTGSTNIKFALMCWFRWNRTPEGEKYWQDLYYSLPSNSIPFYSKYLTPIGAKVKKSTK
jgi:hypothetical protein